MDPLLETREGRVAILTMNRPDALNALTEDMNRAMVAAFIRLSADPDVGAIILTGAGRAFCAGGDVKRMGARTQAPALSRAEELRWKQALPLAIHNCAKLVIAAINGPAVGAGLSLALAADFRIMSRKAILKCGFADVGLSGDFGISHSLVRLVGPARAKELLVLSPKVAADEALGLGLVSSICDAEDFDREAMAFASRLAAGPRTAWAWIKRNLAEAETESFEAMLELEIEGQVQCMATEDHAEALLAFGERRAPQFRGR